MALTHINKYNDKLLIKLLSVKYFCIEVDFSVHRGHMTDDARMTGILCNVLYTEFYTSIKSFALPVVTQSIMG